MKHYMHYEHTWIGIFCLIVGVYLTTHTLLITFGGTQWIPFQEIKNTFLVACLYDILKFGLIFGPILIAFGIIFIKREFEVRDLERKARGI